MGVPSASIIAETFLQQTKHSQLAHSLKTQNHKLFSLRGRHPIDF